MSKLYIDEPMRKIYKEYDNKNYLNKKKLKILEVENATILPPKKRLGQWNPICGKGGIVDNNNNYIKESAQTAKNMYDRVNGKYKYNKNNVEFRNETVIYLNHFIKHWGHFLIDVIGRMWYKNKKYKYVFTTNYNEDLRIEGSFLEFIRYCGIDINDIIIINKPTKFKKIIIPETSYIPGDYYTKEYINIFREVIKNCPKEKKNIKKIYFSRQSFNRAKSKEVGESKIEKFFLDNDFIPVSPEKLSLKEQINYIQSADEIVAINGTLPHNIMFAKENTKLILLNKTYSINFHNFLMNQASNCNATFIDVHKSLLPVLYGYGPFIMKITNNLIKFAKDNKYKVNIDIDKNKKMENIKYILKYIKMYKGRIIKDKNVSIITLFKYYKNK